MKNSFDDNPWEFKDNSTDKKNDNDEYHSHLLPRRESNSQEINRNPKEEKHN